jgi:23S rRNA (adenine2503-C2)-methyltransferase
LPFYTKDAVWNKQNNLTTTEIGSRKERWMIGISCMSGCPIGCKFCATGQLKFWKSLTADEMIEQIIFVLQKNRHIASAEHSREFKINYTRMGEPFLNIDNIQKVIKYFSKDYPKAHHYISTIGIKDSDFSWIKDNITLQISLHSLDEARRRKLIPAHNLMSIEELGKIRTSSNLKTTLNLTLVDNKDFDIDKLKKYFDPKYFFVKLSQININAISKKNNLGNGIIEGVNLL